MKLKKTLVQDLALSLNKLVLNCIFFVPANTEAGHYAPPSSICSCSSSASAILIQSSSNLFLNNLPFHKILRGQVETYSLVEERLSLDRSSLPAGRLRTCSVRLLLLGFFFSFPFFLRGGFKSAAAACSQQQCREAEQELRAHPEEESCRRRRAEADHQLPDEPSLTAADPALCWAPAATGACICAARLHSQLLLNRLFFIHFPTFLFIGFIQAFPPWCWAKLRPWRSTLTA